MKRSRRHVEITALGLLLDHTYEEVAAAARAPRQLDRNRLIGWFDLWDNHLILAVSAASIFGDAGRSAGRAVWRSIGAWARPAHRDWIATFLVSLGLDPDVLLGPAPTPLEPYLNYAGHISAVPQQLTRQIMELINADYDLVGGHIEHALIEINATEPGKVHGQAVLSAPRRKYTDQLPTCGAEPHGWATLRFDTDDLISMRLPHAERDLTQLAGPLVVPAACGAAHITVETLNGPMSLTGERIEYCPKDIFWYDSTAGRATTVGTPRSRTDWPQVGLQRGQLWTLAMLQRNLILLLRMMRYPRLLRRRDLEIVGSLCDGLGTATIAAASHIRALGRQERAAGRLLRALVDQADETARALIASASWSLPALVPTPVGRTLPTAVPVTSDNAGHLIDDLNFVGGRLRLVDISVDRREGHMDETVIHMDAQRADNGEDTIAVVVLKGPRGNTPLTIGSDGLDIVAQPSFDFTADGVTLTIPLNGQLWTAHATSGTWYAD